LGYNCRYNIDMPTETAPADVLVNLLFGSAMSMCKLPALYKNVLGEDENFAWIVVIFNHSCGESIFLIDPVRRISQSVPMEERQKNWARIQAVINIASCFIS